MPRLHMVMHKRCKATHARGEPCQSAPPLDCDYCCMHEQPRPARGPTRPCYAARAGAHRRGRGTPPPPWRERPMNVDAIAIGFDPPADVNVIIEVPIGGEPIKYELDKAS